MNHSRPFKGILVTIILFEIIICIFFIFIFEDIKNKNENISVIKNNILVQTEKQKYTANMLKMIKNTDSNIAKVNSSIIQKEDDIKFIENIEGIARKNGVKIEINTLSFRDDPILTSNNLTMFIVKSTISGNWLGIYSFIYELESLPLKIKIDKLSLFSSIEQMADVRLKPGALIKSWQGTFELSVLKYK